jgi:hypothetical protein
MQLAMKDAEIQSLQATLQSREASSQTAVMESLKSDLTSLIDNNQKGAFVLFQENLSWSCIIYRITAVV